MNAVKEEAFTVSFGKTSHSFIVREFIIISESKRDLVHLPANSAQRLQIFPSVYSSLVIVDFIEHD